MGTADNRPRYNRDKLRYPSDLTDAEWAHIEPLIPPGKPGGGKRRVAIREVINGVMYILSTGCQWRALPKDLPPRSTVHDYLGLWNWDGTLDRTHHAGTVNLMAAGERLSPIAFVKRPLLLPAIPPWLRCEIGEASGGKSGGAGR